MAWWRDADRRTDGTESWVPISWWKSRPAESSKLSEISSTKSFWCLWCLDIWVLIASQKLVPISWLFPTILCWPKFTHISTYDNEPRILLPNFSDASSFHFFPVFWETFQHSLSFNALFIPPSTSPGVPVTQSNRSNSPDSQRLFLCARLATSKRCRSAAPVGNWWNKIGGQALNPCDCTFPLSFFRFRWCHILKSQGKLHLIISWLIHKRMFASKASKTRQKLDNLETLWRPRTKSTNFSVSNLQACVKLVLVEIGRDGIWPLIWFRTSNRGKFDPSALLKNLAPHIDLFRKAISCWNGLFLDPEIYPSGVRKHGSAAPMR